MGTSTEAEVYIERPTSALSKHGACFPRPDLLRRLQANVTLPFAAAELSRLFIVADVHLGVAPPPTEDGAWSLSSEPDSALAGLGVSVRASKKGKCPRCWTYALPVGGKEEVCGRCKNVLESAKGL